MANRYWVGGNANWDATAGTKWALTSGGAGGQAVPTSADDVFLDNGTGTGNVTISANAACRSLNCTNYTGILTHNASVTLTIGDGTAGASNVALKLVSGMTYTRNAPTSSKIDYVSTSATQQSVDYAGFTVGNTTFNGAGGSWILTGDIGGAGQTTTLTAGSLDTNGRSITTKAMNISGSATRSLTLGASTITITDFSNGTWTATTTNLTFSAASSTLLFPGNGDGELFRGGGLSYGSVSFTGTGTKTITGANSFVNFTRSNAAACGIKFPSNVTQTFTGTVSMSGASGAVLTITASTANQAATLSKAGSAVVVCDYLSLKDSTATGGATWYAGANSSVVSGVTGWTLIYYPDTVSGTIPLTGTATESYDSGTVYTDTATGTIPLSGTASDSAAYADAASGTVTLTGGASEAHSAADTASGTLPLTGTATEGRSASDAASGTISLTGSVVESHSRTYADTATGTIRLSGSVVESQGHAYVDSCSGTLPIGGTSSDSVSHADTASGTITLNGAVVVSHGYTDSASGLIFVTGTATDALARAETAVGVLALAGAVTERFHVGPPVKDVSITLSAAGAVLGVSSANGVALALQSMGSTRREALLPGEDTLPGSDTYPSEGTGSTLEIRPESDVTLETETTELEMSLD